MPLDWQLSIDDIKNLEFDKQIGEGSYGRVFKALLPSTGAIYAVKVVDIADAEDTFALKTTEQEISVLRSCASCPQIVQIFGVRLNDLPQLKVVMEFCDHGSVCDILRKLQKGLLEEEIRIILYEVLLGLKFLHDDKKIHRDVKGGNILVTKEFWPKLADFGISAQLQNTCARRNTRVGSPYWMAPEVIKGVAHGYDARADIWSLGITGIELAERQPPYFNIQPCIAMLRITKKPPGGLENPKQYSEDFVNFILKCLTVNAGSRPLAQTLLEMPFMKQAQKQAAERSPAQMLAASLGPRLANAPEPRPGGSSQPSENGSMRSPGTGPRLSGGLAPFTPLALPPIGAVTTPSVDALARRSQRPPSPNAQFRKWQDSTTTPAIQKDREAEAEEIRRRAREWVNRTVPMQMADDDSDVDEVIEVARNPEEQRRGGPVIWDSDEEGVETRVRQVDKPDIPFFMQVIAK